MCNNECFTDIKHASMAAGRIGAFHEIICMISDLQEEEEADGKATLQKLVLSIRNKISEAGL